MRRWKAQLWLLGALFMAAAGLLLADELLRSAAAAGTVTCAVPSDAYGTIQGAVDDAGCDRIDVVAGTYGENVTVDRPVMIAGAGAGTDAASTVVDGGGNGSVFHITGGATVTLTGMTIRNGRARLGAGIYIDEGNLWLVESLVTDNAATVRGGGVKVSVGTAHILSSTIRSNAADAGAGISIYPGEVRVLASRVSSNTAVYGGGGIETYPAPPTPSAPPSGRLELVDSVVRDNVVQREEGEGGGLLNRGRATIVDSGFLYNSAGYGGAILSDSPLTLTRALLQGNEAVYRGGGIATRHTSGDQQADTRISYSLLISNTAGERGGGISAFHTYGATTMVLSSTIRNNSSAGHGGGIFVEAPVQVRATTISDNRAPGSGGGIMALGAITVANSTLSGNEAYAGGGFYYGAYFAAGRLLNVTLSDNAGSVGAAVASVPGGTELGNTIVANAGTPAACADINVEDPGDPGMPAVSLGHNLDEDGSCGLDGPGDLSGVALLLGPLADNGGPQTPGGVVRTHLPFSVSEAIDHGDDALCAAAPVNGVDQRGLVRPEGSACDIGAVEGAYVLTEEVFLSLVMRSSP